MPRQEGMQDREEGVAENTVIIIGCAGCLQHDGSDQRHERQRPRDGTHDALAFAEEEEERRGIAVGIDPRQFGRRGQRGQQDDQSANGPRGLHDEQPGTRLGHGRTRVAIGREHQTGQEGDGGPGSNEAAR